MDESWRKYTTFTIGNLGFFKCNPMTFGLCNVPATFQWLMQNCLKELNLIYHLIYLNDIVIFLWTIEKHLHCLSVVFDWFREYNLKLKPSKRNFFKEEITYLAHRVSKDGIQPSSSYLEAITEYALPGTYTEVCAFIGLVGHYWRFIKGFTHIAQPLNEFLAGERSQQKVRMSVTFPGCCEGFQNSEAGVHDCPILAFTDYTKQFLLETDVSKNGLGVMLLQKQIDRWYHPITYGSQALTTHEKNYHSTKLEFLALKWAVTELHEDG